MNREEIFERLATVGGLSVVRDRDGTEYLVVNDPWMVANPEYMKASWIVTIIGVLVVLMGFMTSPIVVGLGSVCFVVAMYIRALAPRNSGLSMWNEFLVLGKVSEFEKEASK